MGYFGKAPNTQPNRLDMELLHYDPLVWNFYRNEVSVLLNQLEISMIDIYNYLLEMNLKLIPEYIRPLISIVI